LWGEDTARPRLPAGARDASALPPSTLPPSAAEALNQRGARPFNAAAFRQEQHAGVQELALTLHLLRAEGGGGGAAAAWAPPAAGSFTLVQVRLRGRQLPPHEP
jgi:hypothetical protein